MARASRWVPWLRDLSHLSCASFNLEKTLLPRNSLHEAPLSLWLCHERRFSIPKGPLQRPWPFPFCPSRLTRFTFVPSLSFPAWWASYLLPTTSPAAHSLVPAQSLFLLALFAVTASSSHSHGPWAHATASKTRPRTFAKRVIL